MDIFFFRKIRHARRGYLLAVLLFAAFAFLYIYTAPSGVYDGDSGELTAVVHTLGLAHSTGFPLYILSGKLFTLIFPFGDVAFRLNVFSGLITALAISLFFLMLLDLELSALASFLAATIFGLGSSIWSNAGVARVYPLAMLCMVILLWIFIRWQKEHKISYIYWYAFIWGLSFGTHLLMLVMIWPFVFMLWQERAKLRVQKKIIGRISLLFLVPFLQYLYIPIASARHTTLAWGNVSSVSDFISYITQRQYAFKMLNRGWDGTLLFFGKIFSLISSELTIVFFILSLIGLTLLYRKNKMLCRALLLMGATAIAIMLAYGSNTDLFILYRYVFPVYLVFAVGNAYCIAALQRIDTTKWFAAAVILLLIFAEFQVGYAQNNRRTNFIVEDTARNIFQTVEPHSIVFAILDPIFGSLSYLQSYGYRNDVIVVEPELLSVDWYVENLIRKYPDTFNKQLLTVEGNGARVEAVIRDNIATRNTYGMFVDFRLDNNKTLANDLDLIPVGILHKIIAKNGNAAALLVRNDTIWSEYQMRSVVSGISHATMAGDLSFLYSDSLYGLGLVYLRAGLLLQAERAFQSSISINDTALAEQGLMEVQNGLGNGGQ